jgi:hypothetical protein
MSTLQHHNDVSEFDSRLVFSKVKGDSSLDEDKGCLKSEITAGLKGPTERGNCKTIAEFQDQVFSATIQNTLTASVV